MKLYLVRHAQSLRNLGKEHDKLSETGIEQAKRLGLFLKDKHIDYVYCSQYERAKETLNQILLNLKNVKKTIYTEEINEHNQGIFDKMPGKEWHYHLADLREKGVDLLNYRPEGGETLLELEKRTQNFLDFLKKKHNKEEHILIVSHGMFLRLFILRPLRFSIEEAKYFDIHNASLSEFELDKNFNVKDFEINNFKHLLKYSSYKRENVEKV